MQQHLPEDIIKADLSSHILYVLTVSFVGV